MWILLEVTAAIANQDILATTVKQVTKDLLLWAVSYFPTPFLFFFFRKLQDEKTDTCPILQKLMSALHVQARTERHVGILSKVTAVIAP